MSLPELPLFVLWEKVLGDLLDRTQGFPKRLRFVLTQRIENLGIDVLEAVTEACYARPATKVQRLRDADLALLKLRVLLRLAHQRRCLSNAAHEHLARRIDEAGRMLGGWRKELAQRAG